MDFNLIYLQEGRTYGVEDLCRCVGKQLPELEQDQPWLNGEFFNRLAAAMNRNAKIVNVGKDKFTFGFIGLYDYMDETTEKELTFFFMPKFCAVGEGNDVASEKRDAVLIAIDRYVKELKLPEVQGEASEAHKESLLELAVRVLRDYLENGVYTVRRRELEHNGQGEIDWETTIDQYQPMFLKGQDGGERPVYMDTATELANSDEDHYITRLHQCLVTTWGRKLETLGLSSVLRVNVPLLSEDEIDSFGDADVQIDRITKELNVQFVTKSRNTLTLMKDLIEQSSNRGTDLVDQLSFGTNKAEHLWETACARVLGSELKEKISECEPTWGRTETFGEYMPSPIWKRNDKTLADFDYDKDAYWRESEKSGWRLDFIRTWPPNGKKEKLVILDAKYYGVYWEKGRISGQPGIGDIVKQLFYQMAFADLAKDSGIKFVNAFLFPDDDEMCKDEKGCPAPKVSEQVWLGWSGKAPALAFADVNLFAVRIPGIELLKRYAHWMVADDWFNKIVEEEPH